MSLKFASPSMAEMTFGRFNRHEFVMPIRPNDTSTEAIAARLRAVLEARGMKPGDLTKGDDPFPANAVSQWVHATHPPSLANGLKLCDRLGITMDFLYRGRVDGMPFDLVNRLAA